MGLGDRRARAAAWLIGAVLTVLAIACSPVPTSPPALVTQSPPSPSPSPSTAAVASPWDPCYESGRLLLFWRTLIVENLQQMAALPSGETGIAEHRVPEYLREGSQVIADDAHCFGTETAEDWRAAITEVQPDADGFSIETALHVAANLPWKPLVMGQ